jgi:hypothetical protein
MPTTPSVTPAQAREAEIALETKITRIWTLLSAFEESSAACISDMLLHVSNGAYIEGSLMAAKFIVHVEVLFGAIDQLDVLSMRASGQCSYRQYVVNYRSSISKGSQITLSEDRQFFRSSKQNIRSRRTTNGNYSRFIKSGHRISTLSQNPDSPCINSIPTAGIEI